MQNRTKRSVIILGCTGSIGTTALRALESLTESFEVVGLSAHSAVGELTRIARTWNCKNVCISGARGLDSEHVDFLEGTSLYFGEQGIVDLIRNTDADIVLNAIAGSSGLPATFAAIENHMDVALSNKESIVMAGNLLFEYADDHGVKIIPVDSEHSTLYALLEAFGPSAVHSLVLTASGGPFRNYPLDKMSEITVGMATAHPTWKMGAKISIDSATLANKGLEVIEASFLFGFSHASIEVVIHPQSVVHSLIRMHNGALYAQLSPPDMSLPIMSALSDKKVELHNIVHPLDFSNLILGFQKPDHIRFPLLPLAFDCAREQRGYPIAYNAANEIAVQAFVKGEITFDKIVRVVGDTLARDWHFGFSSMEDILGIDSQARSLAAQVVGNIS